MKLNHFLTAIAAFFCMDAIAQYPTDVQAALDQTKNNQTELTAALNHFYKTNDALKIRSINFLIANMPIHESYNYYWADGTGKRITYSELSYASFNEAVSTVDQLKSKYPGLHPVPYTYRDIDSVTAKMLIDNVDIAVAAYRQQQNKVSEDDFLEYILPYRESVEPLAEWRNEYASIFKNTFKGGLPEKEQLTRLNEEIKERFKNIYGIEKRTEPLPRLSSQQILFRGKGLCEDIADMTVFIARSQGVAAAVDNIPAWATANGDHFLNTIILGKNQSHFDFDGTMDTVLGREPAKVLRTTYSLQKDAIATWLDTAYIPHGFLRLKNYKDVTKEYWPVDSFTVNLFTGNLPQIKAVYLCVLNTASWKPVWYGLKHGNTATFKNMAKGVVYLPMYYLKGTLFPASWPYVLGYNNKAILKPDTLHTHSITMKEQEKYLKYRPGKKYSLYYWSNTWKLLAEKTAPANCTELVFDKVPTNALLVMIPEYSQRKERPFMILDNGERVWW